MLTRARPNYCVYNILALYLLTTIALSLYFLGSAPGGNIRASSLDVTIMVYVISVFVAERATAAAAAIGVWLFAVVLYDLGLMGLLLAEEEQAIGQNLFSILIVANPTDAYHIFNLTSFESTRLVAGMADIGAGVNPALLAP